MVSTRINLIGIWVGGIRMDWHRTRAIIEDGAVLALVVGVVHHDHDGHGQVDPHGVHVDEAQEAHQGKHVPGSKTWSYVKELLCEQITTRQ